MNAQGKNSYCAVKLFHVGRRRELRDDPRTWIAQGRSPYLSTTCPMNSRTGVLYRRLATYTVSPNLRQPCQRTVDRVKVAPLERLPADRDIVQPVLHPVVAPEGGPRAATTLRAKTKAAGKYLRQKKKKQRLHSFPEAYQQASRNNTIVLCVFLCSLLLFGDGDTTV